MADDNDKKTKRYTGTMKYLDKQKIGYIVPDIEVFVTPPSLSSETIKEGDRVEFGIKFCDSNPQFEAIDVAPIKVQCFNCRKYGHSTRDCRQKSSNCRGRCYRCGVIGHFARDCGGKKSVVCVKKREDVKKVEEVEDCFILEFDPSIKDEEYEKNMQKNDDDDDCEELSSIVCVKNVEDVKKAEEVEDCFILDFDPDEPVKFSNLSLCNDSEDVSILAEKGQVACRDYPHPRNLCVVHPFNSTPHEIHCKMCYCYVCEKPAPCKSWTEGSIYYYLKHCDATDIPLWRRMKDVT
ncbi:Cold shock protein 1 [Bienertia sinuspersici]